MRIMSLMAISAAAAAFAGFSGAAMADAAAGKATFDKVCAECHETADFSGENAQELAATIEKISAGQVKHKKAIKLSAQEAADVAAFMVK